METQYFKVEYYGALRQVKEYFATDGNKTVSAAFFNDKPREIIISDKTKAFYEKQAKHTENKIYDIDKIQFLAKYHEVTATAEKLINDLTDIKPLHSHND